MISLRMTVLGGGTYLPINHRLTNSNNASYLYNLSANTLYQVLAHALETERLSLSRQEETVLLFCERKKQSTVTPLGVRSCANNKNTHNNHTPHN